MDEEWVIDASMEPIDGMFCFVPIEGDLHGDFTLIVGVNFIARCYPVKGKLVGVVHPDGQEAVEKFMKQYGHMINKQMGMISDSWQIGDEIIEQDDVTIVMPEGALGRCNDNDLLEAGLRVIAEAASKNTDKEWAEKYGTNFENHIFMMHCYCWCDQDDCRWCSYNAPNFRYKTADFEVRWYKYIGRDMKASKELSSYQIAAMVADCLKSLERKE